MVEVTKANEYIKDREKVIDIPSGAKFKIRKLSAYDFLDNGEIPKFISSIKETKGSPKGFDKLTSTERTEALGILTKIVCAGVVEPSIVNKTRQECTDDELPISCVDDTDKQFLLEQIVSYTGATGHDVDVIKKFPEGEVGRDSGSDSKKIQPVTNTGSQA